MNHAYRPTRRQLLAGFAAITALPLTGPALAVGPLDAADYGLIADSVDDQTATLRTAISEAVAAGRPLFIPGGTYLVADLEFPALANIIGVPSATILAPFGSARIAQIDGAPSVNLDGITFAGETRGPSDGDSGLIEIVDAENFTLSRCAFLGSAANGLVLRASSGTIADGDFDGHAFAAIFSLDSNGLRIADNRIRNCANNGILIWGSENRRDASIVTGNTISAIDWVRGGNGQNGNGINVFRADAVILADNQISDCAFSAIRLNSTSDTQVSGNICTSSGEVAIFSEFAFSGSIIANNVVDGAAGGISMTNLDAGGRLAICSGNLVRNIAPRSETNPDTTPFGIHGEADTVITGNAISAVPGTAITAGWGPFLDTVIVTDNIITDAEIGIAVSVVDDPAVGPVRIDGNVLSKIRGYAIIGMAWDDIVTPDLARDAAQFPHVSMGENAVG
ncbi:MAG: hypothetical protein JWR75_2033 [Devosia sp.]|nr:hypothetical protein [Devosia sp.]